MLSDDQRFPRKVLAERLAEAGYPISVTYLGKLAHRGAGPPYELFCGKAIYTWGTALAWARARVKPPRVAQSAA